MKTYSKLLPLLCCPLFLSGCGDAYELVKVSDSHAYSSGRTAGSGYTYVLKSMMPPKELKVQEIVDVKRDWTPEVPELPMSEPVQEVAEVSVVEPQPEPEPIAPADDIFLQDGKK